MNDWRAAVFAITTALAVAGGCQPAGVEPRAQPIAPVPPEPAPTAEKTPEPPPNHRLLVSTEDCTRPSAEVVTQEDARADLAVVEHLLRTGYAGYDVLAEEGHDWERAFSAARSGLKHLGPSPAVRDLNSFLVEAFAFTKDGHLVFRTLGADGKGNGGSSTWLHADAYVSDLSFAKRGGKVFLEGDEVFDCAGQDPTSSLRPTWVDGRPSFLFIRLSQGAPEPLTCRTRSASGAEAIRRLTFRSLRVPKRSAKGLVGTFSESKDGIPIVRINRFDSSQHEQMQALIEGAERLRDEPVIVIDVRSNPGGKGDYGRDFVLNMTSHTLHENVIEEVLSPAANQGTVNWATCELARSNLDASARAHFTEKRNHFLALLDDMPRGEKSWRVRKPQQEGKAPQPYAGSVIVLTDRRCGSACDQFVMFARQLPGTLVVGENTAGVSVFGESRGFRLPRSGIWMHMGIKWFHDPVVTKVAKEGDGHMPDLWLDTEDPLAAALGIARCMKTKTCADRVRSHQ